MKLVPNEYIFLDDHIEIRVTRRNGEVKTVKIDTNDYELVKQHNWHVRYMKCIDGYYASYSEYYREDGRAKYHPIHMHRYLVGSPDNKTVDHRNRDSLDNRRDNLRITDTDKNLKNRNGCNSNSKTKIRNVCWIEKEQRYYVQLQVNGKNTLLGKFNKDELEEAKKFANEMRKKYYKEYEGIG